MKIIIADNHYLSRSGTFSLVKELFQDAEIKEIFTPGELLQIVPENNTELLIIDPNTAIINDIVELSVFRKRNYDTSILVITSNKQYSYIRKILDAGIIDLIFKDCERETIEKAIHAALNKNKYFDKNVSDIIMNSKSKDNNGNIDLSKAEKAIVRLIAQGFTTKEIASKKFLSVHTIVTHRKNIYRKLNINNSSELLMYAVKKGIIDTTEYYI